MSRKLVAILACRNGGSRLYAKPLQNLDNKKNITTLQFLITNLKKQKTVDEIGLAISNKKENLIYKEIAKKNSIKFTFGDDNDVLSRLIKCGDILKATDILRLTTESPFPYLINLNKIWKIHSLQNYDATFLDNIIDGCGFEIISLNSLKKSKKNGKKKHKSELCSLYIRENFKKFKILKIKTNKNFFRRDLRLTIDNPEDLIVCKKIFEKFKKDPYNLKKIISYLDKNPSLKELTLKYCEKGYKNMYV
jgi:spore coat polysaccharide biosynthesis protein SpsF